MYSILIGKDENICANCKHFFPHYVKAEGGFARLREGHCNYPRLKTRDVFMLTAAINIPCFQSWDTAITHD